MHKKSRLGRLVSVPQVGPMPHLRDGINTESKRYPAHRREPTSRRNRAQAICTSFCPNFTTGVLSTITELEKERSSPRRLPTRRRLKTFTAFTANSVADWSSWEMMHFTRLPSGAIWPTVHKTCHLFPLPHQSITL